MNKEKRNTYKQHEVWWSIAMSPGVFHEFTYQVPYTIVY